MAGPLTVALGAEARYESYEIGAGEPNSYFGGGAQGFSGFRPENAGKNSRNNQSLYLNLEGDITKELSGSLAVRHERYSDFGNTTSGKASARYAFTPQFALRGTVSNGFRAPSLAQEFYTITTTNFLVINGQNTPIETGTFAVGSAAAQALGATALKPERARNLSFGAQWQPTRNWTTTVDLYRIDIDDRVDLLVEPAAVRRRRRRPELGLQNRGIFVGAARYFTNAVDTRTKGVDVVSTYRMNLAQGARADFTLAYNHNDNAVRHVADTPAVLADAGLVLADRQTINRLTVGSPKDKLSLSGRLHPRRVERPRQRDALRKIHRPAEQRGAGPDLRSAVGAGRVGLRTRGQQLARDARHRQPDQPLSGPGDLERQPERQRHPAVQRVGAEWLQWPLLLCEGGL
jgi:iron complex outermembrane receptor protein